MKRFPRYKRLFSWALAIAGLLISITALSLLPQCTFPATQTSPNIAAFASTKDKPKSILLFFDGTSNEWNTRTNVRRLFEAVAFLHDPEVLCHYVDGVGGSSVPVTGRAFGYGMKPRLSLIHI